MVFIAGSSMLWVRLEVKLNFVQRFPDIVLDIEAFILPKMTFPLGTQMLLPHGRFGELRLACHRSNSIADPGQECNNFL